MIKSAILWACLTIALTCASDYAWRSSTKRGFSAGLDSGPTHFSQNVQYEDLRATWYYTWATYGVPYVTGVEFVPMFWNAQCAETPSACPPIPAGSAHVLGFNEPDIPPVNMTVQQAISAWPQVLSVAKANGITSIGSPATAGDPVVTHSWLPTFMAKAGDTVNFTTLHWYKGKGHYALNATAFKEDVLALIQKYNKPVWITEFSPLGADQWVLNASTFSQEEVNQFLLEVIPFLESESMVHRYALFSWSNGTCAIWNETGALTSYGRIYAGIGTVEESSRGDESHAAAQAVTFVIFGSVMGIMTAMIIRTHCFKKKDEAMYFPVE